MSLGAPKSPDPTAVSNAQQGYNSTAATNQNKINSYNQSTPYGSLTYASDPNSPNGYSINTSLTPAQQAILNNLQQTQTTTGQTAATLAGNVQGMYSQPANIDPSAVTNQLMDWQTKYQQPLFDQQNSNLEAQLRNQGLTPGSAAYDNAKNLLARNQGDVTNQFFAQDEPLAFNQAVTQYQLPLQTLQGLEGSSQPTQPAFQQGPTAQVQPPNYTGVTQQNYQNQNAAYGQTLQGAFGIPTALAGGWAKGGFPGIGGAGLSSIGGVAGGTADATILDALGSAAFI